MRVSRKSIGGTAARSAAVHTATTPAAARGFGVDRDDAPVRVHGTHHAHVQLVGKGEVRREQAAAGDQRQILDPRNRTTDMAHGVQADPSERDIICFPPAHRGDASR